MDADTNLFTGSIPNSIVALTELVELDLHLLDLTGAIPVDIADLRKLTFLDLDQNDLSASVPPLPQLLDGSDKCRLGELLVQ